MHHAPGDDVAARRRPERGEIAAQDLGARLERVVCLWLLDRHEPPLGSPVPERRLVVMQHVCAHAGCAPGAPRGDPGEPVLAFEMSQGFLRRHRAGFGKPAHGRREALRLRHLPTGDHLAHRRAEEPVVPPGDEMQRLPHHRCLEDGAACELALERLPPEARRTRPDADVRR